MSESVQPGERICGCGHTIYRQINHADDEWTEGARSALGAVVAARVGQALRDAANESKPISGYMGNHRWISSERLREIAAEYERETDG